MSASYLIKRLFYLLVTTWLVSLIVFSVTQLLPADAAVMILSEYATEDSLLALQSKFGLDQPAYVQYWHWLSGVLSGDFGVSLRTGQPVVTSMLAALSRSLVLAVCSLSLVLLFAIPLGYQWLVSSLAQAVNRWALCLRYP